MRPLHNIATAVGVLLAFSGWGLIAFGTLFFVLVSTSGALLGLHSLALFSSGIIWILLLTVTYGFMKGKKINESLRFLKISRKNESFLCEVYLTPLQRFTRIYIRGFIAIGGYLAYGLAKTSIGIIDNAMIHGADALFYSLTSLWILKQRYSKIAWFAIGIAVAGVSLIFLYDLFVPDQRILALRGWGFGVISSIALAIVIIISMVIVQYDHPVRIAFHQCICGLILSIILLFVFRNQINLSHFISFKYSYALLGGICYASAIICFFYSFLFVEPIVIAMSGASLVIYVAFLERLLHNTTIEPQNIVAMILITLGCIILIYEEHKTTQLL